MKSPAPISTLNYLLELQTLHAIGYHPEFSIFPLGKKGQAEKRRKTFWEYNIAEWSECELRESLHVPLLENIGYVAKIPFPCMHPSILVGHPGLPLPAKAHYV